MAAVVTQTRRVALLGNPNTGKTTVFNQLTGFNARVGNYPGVTVERRCGPLKNSGGAVEVIDLPGTYGLGARSADEIVAVDILLGRQVGEPAPDLIVLVLDSGNLERNMFLASQVLELGIPVVFACNMTDIAEKNGIYVNTDELSKRLDVPVVPVVAARGEGIPDLLSLIDMSSLLKSAPAPELFSKEFHQTAQSAREKLISEGISEERIPLFLMRRALLEINGFAEKRLVRDGGPAVTDILDRARKQLREQGHDLLSLESHARYEWIRKTLDGVVEIRDLKRERRSEKIDAILVHRVWGTMVFAAIMLFVFQAIYSWSGPFMDLIESAFGALGGLAASILPAGPLESFIVDGIIGGVSGVLVFLPQIAILFLFLAILEDCGYMSRAAVLMDRLLGWCGLSGRSFIPLITSFACAVPGIMATRVIEDRRERLVTILIAPLMSCSARLPVYALLIAAFIPARDLVPNVIGLQAAVLFGMYCLGIFIAVPMALILKKTLVRGGRSMFLMELPEYKRPSLKTVFHRVKEQAGAFIVRAGTVILAVSIIIWALTYYPHSPAIEQKISSEFSGQIASAQIQFETEVQESGLLPEEVVVVLDKSEEGAALSPREAKVAEAAANLAAMEHEYEIALTSAWQRDSFLGRAGHVIEPVVKPLGWDWRIGMAVIASFPAREIVVATLGVIFGTDAEDGEIESLTEKLHEATWPDGRPLFTLPVALSIMVFFALCAQCAATLAIMRRETNSWRWPVFAFLYLTTIAYVGAFVVYRVGAAILG